jgi:hypothetical protein
LIWELWHQAVPFNNEIQMASHFVLKENSRPKIINCIEDMDDEENEEDPNEDKNNLKLKLSRMSESKDKA